MQMTTYAAVMAVLVFFGWDQHTSFKQPGTKGVCDWMLYDLARSRHFYEDVRLYGKVLHVRHIRLHGLACFLQQLL